MMLAFYCGKDPAAIDRLFRHSALMRDKWDARSGEGTYGSRTIHRACENLTETYQAPRQDFPDKGFGQELTVEQILAGSGISDLTVSSTKDDVVAKLRVLGSRIKDLDRLTIAALREGAISKLKEIGLQSPTAIIDAALEMYQVEKDSQQGQAILLTDPEPWPDPVEGADLLLSIGMILSRYIVLRNSETVAEALWILNSYCFDAFEICPYLEITSPVMRCGKTHNLTLSRQWRRGQSRPRIYPSRHYSGLSRNSVPRWLLMKATPLFQKAMSCAGS
jgi:hypothetical protein